MDEISRRRFLAASASFAGRLALAGTAAPAVLRRWQGGGTVASEPFGRLVSIAPGVWALISNPFGGDRTTISNGGIVAGRDGVLAIEGFNQAAGATWLAEHARTLTGRWPTHVVVTHFHSDHSNGVAGYVTGAAHPAVRVTPTTRRLVLTRNRPADPARTATLDGAVPLDETGPSIVDLGGRSVRLVPRRGHTPSDVSLEIDDLNVVFCGDLVWNGIFPNYVDAEPSRLAGSVAALPGDAHTTFVPGHGELARRTDIDRYVALITEVERAARAAHAAGRSPQDAAAGYALPPSLGEWKLFGATFFERAFAAWFRELGG